MNNQNLLVSAKEQEISLIGVETERPILIYTLHKCASMFIYRLARELCALKGINLYSINAPKRNQLQHAFDKFTSRLLGSYFPSKGIFCSDDRIPMWNQESGCIAPIRKWIKPPEPDKVNIVLHLRDPRDVLTSLYFSFAFHHPALPGLFNPSDEQRQEWQNMGIDRFILEGRDQNDVKFSDRFLARYSEYCDHILDRSNAVFVKYEEMVSDFSAWLTKVVMPFDFPNEKNITERLVLKFKDEFHTDKEDIFKHKRRITPGDYKEKLKPETIFKLNQMFAPILKRLNYEVS